MKLVYGVGINDKKYPAKINGKNTKQYELWKNMLKRCYSEKSKIENPTYAGCTVSENFKNFSYFYEWVQNQIGFNADGFQLDKDIIHRGNKIYSENACVFVHQEINLFFTDCRATRGELLVGVSFDKARGKYQAQCRVNGKKKHLGYFTTSQEAYAAYKRFKEYLCKKTANKWQSQIDSRAYKSMMNWCV